MLGLWLRCACCEANSSALDLPASLTELPYSSTELAAFSAPLDNSLNVSVPRYCSTILLKDSRVSKISSKLKISLSLYLEIFSSDAKVLK